METEFDAAVIGAGVAGSALAHALAILGWKTLLLDKETFPRHKACGEFLSPETMGMLRALGLDEAVLSLGPAVITQVRLHTEQGVSLDVPLPESALGISRHRLDARLQTSAKEAGAFFHSGFAVSAVEKEAGGYRIHAASRGGKVTFRARIAIGAWGRRAPQGIAPPPVTVPDKDIRIGLKSHYDGAESSPAVDLYMFRGGYIGFAPIEEGRMNAAALLRMPAFRALRDPAPLQRVLEEAAARIPILERRLHGAWSVPGSAAAVSPVVMERRTRALNEIPCIGDAAAVLPPLCGDGMAMALRAVEICAPGADACLRGQMTEPAWQADYARRIEREFNKLLRWGSLTERLLMQPAIASWLLRLGRAAPGLTNRWMRATRLKGRSE